MALDRSAVGRCKRTRRERRCGLHQRFKRNRRRARRRTQEICGSALHGYVLHERRANSREENGFFRRLAQRVQHCDADLPEIHRMAICKPESPWLCHEGHTSGCLVHEMSEPNRRPRPTSRRRRHTRRIHSHKIQAGQRHLLTCCHLQARNHLRRHEHVDKPRRNLR